MTTTPARLNVPAEPAPEPLGSALARLEARWGSAAVRLGNGGRIDGPSGAPATLGALALAPMPDLEPASAPTPGPDHRSAPDPATEAISTGFPALDALLGTGGLPRRAGATLRGDASSGKTTLALRSVAEAQAAGGIVAWLDGGRTFDPLEAAARGVDLRWLVVLRPAEVGEGLRLAGALVSGRAVDLLVLDLPPHLASANEALLRRLAAHARRIGVQLLVLEPVDLAAPLHGALAEAASVRLELERIGWLRLGRDIVGQRTAVTVTKNRFGPPGRGVELEIRYLDDGERAIGVARLLDAAGSRATVSAARATATGPPTRRPPHPRDPGSDRRPGPRPLRDEAAASPPPAHHVQKPPTPLVTIDHAPPAPRLAQPPAPSRAGPPGPGLGTDDAARPRRAAVGSGQRPRSQSGRGTLRRPAGAAAGSGSPARP